MDRFHAIQAMNVHKLLKTERVSGRKAKTRKFQASCADIGLYNAIPIGNETFT
jgi:hypothetical protein